MRIIRALGKQGMTQGWERSGGKFRLVLFFWISGLSKVVKISLPSRLPLSKCQRQPFTPSPSNALASITPPTHTHTPLASHCFIPPKGATQGTCSSMSVFLMGVRHVVGGPQLGRLKQHHRVSVLLPSVAAR